MKSQGRIIKVSRADVRAALTRPMTSVELSDALSLKTPEDRDRVSVLLSGLYKEGQISRIPVEGRGPRKFTYCPLKAPAPPGVTTMARALEAARKVPAPPPPPRAESGLAGALDALLDEVARRVAERLPRGLAAADLLALEQRLYAAFGGPAQPPGKSEADRAFDQPHHGHPPEEGDPRPLPTGRKPRVAIFRLLPQQGAMIKDEFGDKLDLTIFSSGNGTDHTQAKQLARGTYDDVVLLTRFMSHSESELIQVGYPRATLLRGALTELREYLSVRAAEVH